MKLLTKEILIEQGFLKNSYKSKNGLEVMTLNGIEINIKPDGNIYFSNFDVIITLKDTADLRKLLKALDKARQNHYY